MQTRDFDAYWLPGLDTDYDMEAVVDAGASWLAGVNCSGRRILALHAKSMTGNNRALTRAGQRFLVAGTRTQNGLPFYLPNAVLAVYPDTKTLDMAQRLALGGSLCVIPGGLTGIGPWLKATAARSLIDADDTIEVQPLSSEVRKALDSIIEFAGYNGFVGGYDKKVTVERLREMVRSGHRPSPEDVEAYVYASGGTDSGGAGRLRGYYEGILEGRQLRDYTRRPI